MTDEELKDASLLKQRDLKFKQFGNSDLKEVKLYYNLFSFENVLNCIFNFIER